MTAHKSIFDPQNTDDAQMRGGINSYLGPPASAYSHMPGDLIDGEVEQDDSVEAVEQPPVDDPERGVATNPDEPVAQIKEALDEKLAMEASKPDPDTHPAE